MGFLDILEVQEVSHGKDNPLFPGNLIFPIF